MELIILMFHDIKLIYSDVDPCTGFKCNGTNAVCEIVYSTGLPRCTCPKGMLGDPNVACGNVFISYNSNIGLILKYILIYSI